MDKLKCLYERILLKEYSEGFINKEILRLQRQAGPLVATDTIRSTIERFDQLKTNQGSFTTLKNLINGDAFQEKIGDTPIDRVRKEKIKKNPQELTLYTWKDLDNLILHNFEDPEQRRKKKEAARAASTTSTLGAEQVSTVRNLNVYWATNSQQCQELNAWFKKKNHEQIKDKESVIKPIIGEIRWRDGNIYYWCIGWPSSRFDFYRYASNPASVYYVEDTTLPVTDPHHIIIVHAQTDGKFLTTNAFNNYERVITWDQLVSEWQPKLSNLKEIIIFHPFSHQDEQTDKVYERINASSFMSLGTFNLKKGYITRRRQIKKADFLQIVPQLQREYIDIQCHPNVLDRLPQTRFAKIMHPFFDTTNEDRERVNSAREQVVNNCIGDEKLSDEDYNNPDVVYAPWLDDPIMKQSSREAYKLWRKFVIEFCDSCAKGYEEKRGYAND